eukprot:215424_1
MNESSIKNYFTKMSVAEWLKTLKLSQYETTFADNGVDDLEFAASLTESALIEMGITKIGHKCRLSKAIEELNKNSLSSQSQPIQKQPTQTQQQIATQQQITKQQSIQLPTAIPTAIINDINTDKKSSMFEKIKNADQQMEKKMQSNTQYIQHWKLQNIFTIPTDIQKCKNKTLQKIHIIKQMQQLYDSKRLERIPQIVLER